METKRCSKCGEVKSTNEFYFKKKSRDGLTSWCRSCQNKSNRKWALAHPEKRKEIGQRYEEKIKNMGGNVPSMSGVKICKTCGVEKLVTDFHRSPTATDGRNAQCATCMEKKRPKVTVICSGCGNTFEKNKYDVKQKNYCSFACRFGHPVHQVPMTTYTCLHCQKSFEAPTRLRHRKKYCSAWCRLHGKHFWTIGSKKDSVVVCKRCGKDFVPTKPLQRYCSPQCATPNKEVFTKTCRVCEKKYDTNNSKSTVCSMVCAGRSHVGGMSIKATISRHGFREDLGHKVRSTWEANVARWILSRGYEYLYEELTFHFQDFSYTPDFYIPKLDLYVEVKGMWRKNSRQKLDLFVKDYPNTWIIDRKEYARMGFNPNLTKEYTIADCYSLETEVRL